MRILLVEPDKVLAEIYTEALRGAGHDVVATSSAQAAVHLANHRRPDAVVLELQLARHNGVEFLYEFRSYPEWLRVPVIVHTLVPPGELATSATLRQELGVTDILYKPATSLRQLRSTVGRALAIADA